MADSESKPLLSVKLKGILGHTSSTATVLEDGRIELEYFDFSPDANENFGNDVAWMYYVEAAQKPRLYELLGTLTGAPITEDQAMLDAFALRFRDTWAITKWLKENSVLFEKVFDSWA